MIKGFESLPLLNWLLVAAIGLTLMIALFSKFNQHPDEIHHFEAVKYYLDHFLPPVIGDPAVRASYSMWGDSYLNHYWVEYLLAGKFVRLLSFFGVNQLTAARLFQVLLLACLSIFFIYRGRTERQAFIFAAFLLITPQVWYIFSYVNSDAFAFVISILLVYQLADTKSPFNKFIQAEKIKGQVFSGVLCGLLVGALFTGKTNYWVILIFIGLWVLFNYPLNVPALKKYAFILLVAASFIVLRIGADYYVNGETNFAGISYLNYVLRDYENSQGKLDAYQEEVADYSCKQSTLRNNLMASHESLKLRAKGVPFKDLFYKYEWHRLSFYSFIGLYGYMTLAAGPNYYRSMLVLYSLFILYLISSIIRSRNRRAIGQLLVTAFGIFLCLFFSLMTSWSYALQAQGRYLFPIIGMTALLVSSNRQYLRSEILYGFIIGAFLLSCYSIVFVALLRFV